jgi:hypothetical protein
MVRVYERQRGSILPMAADWDRFATEVERALAASPALPKPHAGDCSCAECAKWCQRWPDNPPVHQPAPPAPPSNVLEVLIREAESYAKITRFRGEDLRPEAVQPLRNAIAAAKRALAASVPAPTHNSAKDVHTELEATDNEKT